jgi:hypothetical protein
MNKIRAILTGSLIWLLVFTTFWVLAYLPRLKDSLDLQASIVALLIIPFAILGASIYYKNGNKDHGFVVGITMVITALLLDVLVTVPFVVIPTGGSYESFFTYPLLWVLVLINISTIYFYWKRKIASPASN